MGKLTAKQIENIKDPGVYEDGEGLRLVVKKTGKKSWVLRYQIKGVRRDLGLGGYPSTSLALARNKALQKRGDISKDTDPVEEKIKAKHAKLVAKAKARTFEECAIQYIETHKDSWKNAKHAQQWESTLATYAFPVIGKMVVGAVTTEHVEKILKPIWNTKSETASRVRSRIELILDAAKVRKLREGENPARWRGHLDQIFPQQKKAETVVHHPAMPWRELPEFIAKLSDVDGISARALEFTILTACRTSEVLKATWNEINLEEKVWVIAKERMGKSKRPHRVPLSGHAVKLLKSLPGGGEYVFSGMKEGRPLSNLSMLMIMRRMNKGQFTVHGFRSTFRDWCAECASAPRELFEQALAHTVTNKAEAAYFRSDMFDKRRDLMDDWNDYAKGKPKTGKVVKGKFGK